MVRHVVLEPTGIKRRTGGIDHAGQLQPGTQIEQHILERPHVAIERHDRLADGIGQAIGIADRPVEERDAVMAFEIGGVGQDEIGIGHRLGIEGIGIDEMRDAIRPRRRVTVS